MANGVLDQRLEHEAGNEAIERVAANVIIDPQPVGKAQPLDVEIGLDADELLAQRDFSDARGERASEDQRELAQDAQRGRRRFVRELAHSVERVEEKMGLKLCLEVLESRSGEKGFEAQRARFLGADSRECQDRSEEQTSELQSHSFI